MIKKPKKPIENIVKLRIGAGEAKPAPPVGSMLAPRGVKIMDFCKDFNDRTKTLDKGTRLIVKVIIYRDKSFSTIINQPPASDLLKKAAKIDSGSGEPNKKKIGSLTIAQLKEVLEQKRPNLTSVSEGAGLRTLLGTAKSMGIEIIGEIE